MKKGTLVLVLAIALVGLTGQTWAAETATISVTVEMQSTVSVSVTPGAWDIGLVDLGWESPLTTFMAENNGNVSEDLTITGANGANGWNIAGTPAIDEFTVLLDAVTPLTTIPIGLTGALAVGADYSFDLLYDAPTGDTQGGGVDHSFVITVTASQTP